MALPASVRAFALPAVAAVGPLALLALVAPALPVAQDVGAVLGFATAACAAVLAVSVAPMERLARGRAAALTFVAGVALSLVALVLPPVASGLAGSLGVIACGSVLGCAVGARMAAPGHLLATALLSAAVDVWSVNAPSGITHRVVANPALLQLLTVRAAVAPARAPEPALGFGDVVFAALYVSACARFGFPRGRTTLALVAGLLAAGATGILLGLSGGVPALPFLGVAIVIAHPEARRVAPADRAATWFAGALLAASIVWVARR